VVAPPIPKAPCCQKVFSLWALPSAEDRLSDVVGLDPASQVAKNGGQAFALARRLIRFVEVDARSAPEIRFRLPDEECSRSVPQVGACVARHRAWTTSTPEALRGAFCTRDAAPSRP